MEEFEKISLKPVTRVDLIATLKAIPEGKCCRFTLDELGTLDKVRAAKCRVKKTGVVIDLRVLENGKVYELARVRPE